MVIFVSKFFKGFLNFKKRIMYVLCVCFCSKPMSLSGTSPLPVAASIMAIHDNAGIKISQQVLLYHPSKEQVGITSISTLGVCNTVPIHALYKKNVHTVVLTTL